MSQNIQIIDANTMIGVHPTHRIDMSAERLIRDMDSYRISASMTLFAAGVFHDHSRGNAATLAAAKASNRLVPIATINPVEYFGSAEDLQALRQQGFRFFKFFPGDQGWPITSAAFGEILRQLASLKAPVMISALRPGDPSDVGRMVADYPAPVILCSITRDLLSETLAVMSELPNVMIETHALAVPGALELIAERLGPERIVFGSGAPRRSATGSLQYVISSEISDEARQLVLGGNIKRVVEAA